MLDPRLLVNSATWGEPDAGLIDRLSAACGADTVRGQRTERGELTIWIATPSWRDAAVYLRDQEGYDFLSDVVSADWLGYGGVVAGYWGSDSFEGRDLNAAGSWGKSRVPKPLGDTRFSVSCHLLKLTTVAAHAHARVRIQTWVDDGEPVPSLVGVYPSADYHEREAYDMMGIVFDGHPNLRRILMPEYWQGHPQRKDYPIGGEPVQFSDEV